MNKPVGGRGKKAPYETTHVRIPVNIKDRVEKLKEQFVSGQLDFVDELTAENNKLANEYRKLLTGNSQNDNSSNNSLTSLDTVLNLAKDILKQKRSARESIAKLLTAMYNQKISSDDLK